MVSNRCKMAVITALKKLDLHFAFVDLGEVELMEEMSEVQREQLKQDLFESGLELMDDKKGVLIRQIKNAITAMVYDTEEGQKINFSEFLSETLHHDYTFLSNLFSASQGITIEQCIIRHKVERIKTLILHDELSITEIAWRMNYSSVAHLSNQFKKVTGLSPSHFKRT